MDLRKAAMEKQNITLMLPKDVLKRVKVMVAEGGTSVSALMERLRQDHLARHEGYEQAHQRQSALLTEGLNLGTKGKRTRRREQLHERCRIAGVRRPSCACLPPRPIRRREASPSPFTAGPQPRQLVRASHL